jgi:hypothetical protein
VSAKGLRQRKNVAVEQNAGELMVAHPHLRFL